MKKIISIITVLALVLGASLLLVSCDKEASDNSNDTKTEENKTKVTEELAEVYSELDKQFDFTSKTSYTVSMAEDEDELIMMQYGIVDMEAAEHLSDYFFTMASDYCNTFAAFEFDTELTDEMIAEVKAAVRENYTQLTASALQMYMPEEYSVMEWALENEDETWREYDNCLLFVITGAEEATDVFEAFEELAIK